MQEVLIQLVPRQLLGGYANWKFFLRKVCHFVTLQKEENFSLNDLLQGLKLKQFINFFFEDLDSSSWTATKKVGAKSWSKEPPFDNINNVQKKIKKNTNRATKKDNLQLAKYMGVFANIVFFCFEYLVVPVLRAHFYITNSEIVGHSTLYFRKDDWGVVQQLADASWLGCRKGSVARVVSRPRTITKITKPSPASASSKKIFLPSCCPPKASATKSAVVAVGLDSTNGNGNNNISSKRVLLPTSNGNNNNIKSTTTTKTNIKNNNYNNNNNNIVRKKSVIAATTNAALGTCSSTSLRQLSTCPSSSLRISIPQMLPFVNNNVIINKNYNNFEQQKGDNNNNKNNSKCETGGTTTTGNDNLIAKINKRKLRIGRQLVLAAYRKRILESRTTTTKIFGGTTAKGESPTGTNKSNIMDKKKTQQQQHPHQPPSFWATLQMKVAAVKNLQKTRRIATLVASSHYQQAQNKNKKEDLLVVTKKNVDATSTVCRYNHTTALQLKPKEDISFQQQQQQQQHQHQQQHLTTLSHKSSNPPKTLLEDNEVEGENNRPAMNSHCIGGERTKRDSGATKNYINNNNELAEIDNTNTNNKINNKKRTNKKGKKFFFLF